MEGFTYDQLFQALQSWPEDDEESYTADIIPRLISLAELRVVKDLNLNIFDVSGEAVLTVNDNIIAKPDDMIALRTMRGEVQATGVTFPIEMRSLDWVKNVGSDPAVRAQPRYVADVDELQWSVGTLSDNDYDIQLLYVARPDGLTPTNQTTWLGDKVGDLIFNCALMEAEQYLKVDDRYADMKAKYYGELLPVARLELRNHVRNGDYTPVRAAAKPVG